MTKTILRGVLIGLFIIALLVPTFAVGCGNKEEVTLSSIEVYPSRTVQLGIGQVSQFLATATYSDGSTEQAPADVSWSSSDTAVATIGSDGLASAKAVGTTTITATLEDQTGSANVVVSKLPATEITIVDSEGRQVTIPQPLERAVVMHTDGVETIRSIGAKDKIVGMSKSALDLKEFFADLQDRTNVGTSPSPSYETIINLKPQVVIAYGPGQGYSCPADFHDKLAAAGIPVVYLDCFKPPTLSRDIVTLGMMFNAQDRAAELVAFFDSYLDKVDAVVAKLKATEKVRVYFESWTNYSSAAEGSGYHDMIVAAGGINVFAGYGAAYPKPSPEAVLEKNPAAVLKNTTTSYCASGYTATDSSGMEGIRNSLLSRSGWAGIDAVINNKVWVISNEIIGGAKKPIGTCYLAKLLYPEKLIDLDPAAMLKEYLEKYQGLTYKGVYVYPS